MKIEFIILNIEGTEYLGTLPVSYYKDKFVHTKESKQMFYLFEKNPDKYFLIYCRRNGILTLGEKRLVGGRVRNCIEIKVIDIKVKLNILPWIK